MLFRSVNNDYVEVLKKNGLRISGINPNSGLVEVIELPDHLWFLGVQYHPELKSRVLDTHPLFREFVRAAIQHKTRRLEQDLEEINEND